MDFKLQCKLNSKYPDLLNSKTAFSLFGITCGDGWYKILDELLKNIDDLKRDFDFEFSVLQIKEKFGALRFYYFVDVDNFKYVKFICDFIDKFVETAEKNSRTVCELCGDTGKLYTSEAWVETRCENCKM